MTGLKVHERLSRSGVIVARHSSGKWLRADTPSFDQNVKHMRNWKSQQTKTKCSIITRTEGADPEANKSIKIPGDGWGVFQPQNKIGGGLTDCSIEWLQEYWHMVDAGVQILTDLRIKTAKGFLLPPSQMPWVILEPKDPEWARRWRFKKLLVSSAHNNLQNTDLRSRAWRVEGDTFTQFQIRHQAPGLCRYHCGDINQDYRVRQDRRLVREHYLRGTRMRNGWTPPPRLPIWGTHNKALLDQPFSNAHMRTILLPDDSSSDHRPLETAIF